MEHVKERVKTLLKEFTESQESYKLAIKKYLEYRQTYNGVRSCDVPEDIRSAVSKCRYPLGVLQSKSNEVRIILYWINMYYKGIKIPYDLIPTRSNGVKRTILKIKKEIENEM